MEDTEIIELYLHRDERAISETSTKYGKYCKTIANNITYNENDTEECINDTYLKTWNSIPPYIPQWFKAYIGRIVRNLAIDVYRKNKSKKRGNGEIEIAIHELEDCIPASENVEAGLERAEVLRVVNEFLDSIDEKSRDIFMRRYWYTENSGNIAKMYNMSESNVRVTLHRLRQQLKERMMNEDIFI